MATGEIVLAGIAVSPVVSELVKQCVKPTIDLLTRQWEKHREKIDPDYSVKIETYIDRTLRRCGTINTLVSIHTNDLHRLYIPLTVFHDAPDSDEKYKIDNSCANFLTKHKHLLIVDAAGMGKSTLLKFMYICAVNKLSTTPIFLELRRLNSKLSVLQYICDEIKPLNNSINMEFLTHLLAAGNFTFFLDGYDEIPVADRPAVTRDLQQFIEKTPQSSFIMSSRNDLALSAFRVFKTYKIRELTPNEAKELIKLYDNEGETYRRLEKEMSSPNFEKLNSFLGNPLMVSLLYGSYRHGPRIPFKRVAFYDQVYDALFEQHDWSKGDAFFRDKKSNLDKPDFKKSLEWLGYLSIISGSSVEYRYEELVELCEKVKLKCGFSCAVSDYISDLVHAVPMLIQDGPYYRWSHKSFQEYFAALCIRGEIGSHRDEIIQKMFHHKNAAMYLNIIEFYYDIDQFGFDRIITSEILTEFLEYSEKHYKKMKRGIRIQQINLRKGVTFGYKVVIAITDKAQESSFWDSKFDQLSKKLGSNVLLSIVGKKIKNLNPVRSIRIVHRIEPFCSLLQRHNRDLFISAEQIKTLSHTEDTMLSGVSAKEVIIEDDPGAWYNAPKMFDSITRCAIVHDISILDVEKCKAELEVLRERIEEEKRDTKLWLNGI